MQVIFGKFLVDLWQEGQPEDGEEPNLGISVSRVLTPEDVIGLELEIKVSLEGTDIIVHHEDLTVFTNRPAK
jgi:hypothetical protein